MTPVAEPQRQREPQRVSLPTGVLELTVHDSECAPAALLGFAARANARRGFLFLSKVLGKHWPVTPQRMTAIHDSLAAGVPPAADGPVVFIGMAETATGLGQGVFEAWLRRHPGRPALYLHTTRYRVGTAPLIEFEEAHSHAPRQFLHLPTDPAHLALLHAMTTLVLVDDEASTGNTFYNLAAVCRALQPALARVHLSTITNFMGAEARAALSQRFGLPVTAHACLNGEYRFDAGQLSDAPSPAQRYDADAERGASTRFGRCGVSGPLTVPDALVRSLVAQLGATAGAKAGADAAPVLVLGTGEFMHPAHVLGAALAREGIEVAVQSTTRSPILCWGAVEHKLEFADNYGEGIANFLYNVAPGQYRQVLICHETPPGAALLHLAGLLGARLFHFTTEDHVEEIPVC